MEENLGQLVPAEIAPQIALSAQQEYFNELFLDEVYEREKSNYPEDMSRDEVLEQLETLPYDDDYRMESELRYSMLERLELSRRIRRKLERYFGPDGMSIVGSGMSMDVFTPLYKMEDQVWSPQRRLFSNQLWRKRQDMLEQDYYAVDPASQEEIWRVSIRLAALNNVDYGQFVNDLKAVVEPIMTAYQKRTELLKTLQQRLGAESLEKSRILVLGRDPDAMADTVREQVAAGASISELIDQTYIFSDTLQDLMENRSIVRGRNKPKSYSWIDPDKATKFPEDDRFVEILSSFDCVIVIEDDPLFDMDLIREHTITQAGDAEAKPVLMDFRNHKFLVDPDTKQPVDGMLTAKARQDAGETVDISTMYTGIVPIVYKAQRSLLESLIQSIGLAFVMISVVMMLLLRPWGSKTRPTNLLNIRGGMISMLPNMFPVIIVFGFMGHMNRWFGGHVDSFLVDIGSMMTASVAMGVAVDDTIHFLNWYRNALAKGHDRKSAIKVAYDRVATAMTQTTLIGGLGLSAFALSTFTPTQRFGVLMLILLAMALVGDLILLPALIAGPLGKYFGEEKPRPQTEALPTDELPETPPDEPQLRVVEQEEDSEDLAEENPPDSQALPEVILPNESESAQPRRKQSQ